MFCIKVLYKEMLATSSFDRPVICAMSASERPFCFIFRATAFKHVEVGLVAKQALQGPVETDICTLFHEHVDVVFAAKLQ